MSRTCRAGGRLFGESDLFDAGPRQGPLLRLAQDADSPKIERAENFSIDNPQLSFFQVVGSTR